MTSHLENGMSKTPSFTACISKQHLRGILVAHIRPSRHTTHLQESKRHSVNNRMAGNDHWTELRRAA